LKEQFGWYCTDHKKEMVGLQRCTDCRLKQIRTGIEALESAKHFERHADYEVMEHTVSELMKFIYKPNFRMVFGYCDRILTMTIGFACPDIRTGLWIWIDQKTSLNHYGLVHEGFDAQRVREFIER